MRNDLTPHQRAGLFETAFPRAASCGAGFIRGKSPDGMETIYATWFGGQDYRSRGGTDPRTGKLYHGTYPANYLEKILSMFPDAEHVLHAFSGSLTQHRLKEAWGTVLPEPRWLRLDLRTDMLPDIACDAEALPLRRQVDLVLADPPYSEKDARVYNPDSGMPNRRRVMQEIARVTAPGGYLVWLDEVWPMFRKAEWRFTGSIALVRSTNHRVRMAFLFERRR